MKSRVRSISQSDGSCLRCQYDSTSDRLIQAIFGSQQPYTLNLDYTAYPQVRVEVTPGAAVLVTLSDTSGLVSSIARVTGYDKDQAPDVTTSVSQHPPT